MEEGFWWGEISLFYEPNFNCGCHSCFMSLCVWLQKKDFQGASDVNKMLSVYEFYVIFGNLIQVCKVWSIEDETISPLIESMFL